MRRAEEIPPAVVQAACVNWGVLIDAYLVNAARVGRRFTATLFLDGAGVIGNGETIVTPPLRKLASRGDFRLMQSECGRDHYVVVSEYSPSYTCST